jgi:hypothetical protein
VCKLMLDLRYTVPWAYRYSGNPLWLLSIHDRLVDDL